MFTFMISNKAVRDSFIAYLEANQIQYAHYKKGENQEVETAQVSISRKDIDMFKLALSKEDVSELEWYQIIKRYPCFVPDISVDSVSEPVEEKAKKTKVKKTK